MFDIETPVELAKLVDSGMEHCYKAVALSMFAAAGPIAGILALLAAHTLIKTASKLVVRCKENQQEIKTKMLKQYNDFPKTLEEEVVADMAPIVRNDGSKVIWKSVLSDLRCRLMIEGVYKL